MGFLDRALSGVVGTKTAAALSRMGAETVWDLLYLLPRRYQEWGELTGVAELVEGQVQSVVMRVLDVQKRQTRSRMWILQVRFSDGSMNASATFFAKNPYMLISHQEKLVPGRLVWVSGKVERFRGKWQFAHPNYEVISEDPQEVSASVTDVSARGGHPPLRVYPASKALPSWRTQRAVDTVLDTLSDADLPESLPPQLAAGLPSRLQAFRDAHAPARAEDGWVARRRFQVEEAFYLQCALAQVRLRSRLRPSPALFDTVFASQLRSQLPFELTDSQREALGTISDALASDVPASLLLMGDVGSGKTVVALLAAAQTLGSGYSAALLAPTEVLAQQHFATISRLMPDLPAELLTASTPRQQRREIEDGIRQSRPWLLVGTHALLGEQVGNLGLVIVDEQHRFGVDQREKLRESALLNPHLLVMSATPIPRTVAMTAFGDLDTVVISARPSGRGTTESFLVPQSNPVWFQRVWQRCLEEVRSGGRVFVVCPKIEAADEGATVDDTARLIASQPGWSDTDIGVLHGRMSASDKTAAMSAFVDGVTPLLVSTTVIEVGVDVPQATVMVIMDADRFGLAQLHQLRGRVGRGERPAVCLAVTAVGPDSAAWQRLDAFVSTDDGFELAQLDLEYRKEGNVLGTQQSGSRSALRFLRVVDDEDILIATRGPAIAAVEAGLPVQMEAELRRWLAGLEREYLERG